MAETRSQDPGDRRGTLTRMLQNIDNEPQRADELLPLMYDELRALARARMVREGSDQTIQATALVHEAYLRLVGDADTRWNGRRHFFGAAAEAMRRILVERARWRGRVRHGGQRARVEMDDGCCAIEPPGDDVLAVDEALQLLESRDPRKGQIVNLRYFAGLTAAETAAAMGVSVGTIEREWRFIRVWLQDQIADRSGAR